MYGKILKDACMKLNYDALWKLMADLIRDLKRRGESIPPQIMNDLRSLKTMMEIAKLDRSNPNVLRRIEEYLNSLESFLLPITREKLGQEYADTLIEKITEAQMSIYTSEQKPEKRFLIGVPRGKHWIRIKPTEETPLETIRRISEEVGLKHEIQEDGYVLLYGEKEQIKKFVRSTARRPQSKEPSAK